MLIPGDLIYIWIEHDRLEKKYQRKENWWENFHLGCEYMNLCVILPRALTKTKLKKTAAQDFMTKLLISMKWHFSCWTTLYTVSSVRGPKRMCNTSLAAKGALAHRPTKEIGYIVYIFAFFATKMGSMDPAMALQYTQHGPLYIGCIFTFYARKMGLRDSGNTKVNPHWV